MDQREQSGDHTEALQALFDGRQARMWTSMPGIIQSFNAAKMTCEVQIALLGLQTFADGTQKTIQIAPLVDCPVQFPGGGGFTLTFPLQAGDECLIVFASRCIDAWWQSGGIQKQQEFRMHDLSDGFVIPGIRSVPNVPSAISGVGVQLRSDDGSTYLEINESQIVKIVAPGGINLNGVLIDSNGNVSGVKDLTTSGNNSFGGGSQPVKLADNSAATKVKAT